MPKLLLNKKDDVGGGAGDPKDPPASKPGEQPPPKKDDPPATPEGDKKFDDLGYEIVPAKEADQKEGAPPKEGDPPAKDPAQKPEKVENPATGYGVEPPKVDDPPKAPEKKEDPPPTPTELDKKLEGLSKTGAEATKKEIADLGLEGEKADKYIAIRKQEEKAAQDWAQNRDAELQRQDQLRKQTWHKELKEDPAFGGDKYLVNISRSEKVLDEYLPELKKELTEAKQMLRPSVMRGLARLADQLYPDRRMIQGEPPAPESKDDKDKPNDPLAFYQ